MTDGPKGKMSSAMLILSKQNSGKIVIHYNNELKKKKDSLLAISGRWEILIHMWDASEATAETEFILFWPI